MTAAPSQDWQRLCFTFSCLPGYCFPHPIASGRPCGELLAQFASWSPSPLCSTIGTGCSELAAAYSPAGFWGAETSSQELWQ